MELKGIDLPKKLRSLKDRLGKKRLILLIAALGLLLLILSTFSGNEKKQDSSADRVPEFSLEEAERQMENALSRIDGAGKVRVLLTLKAGAEAQLAADQTGESRQQTVIVSAGSGMQEPVIRRYIYPEYQGALITAQGGGVAETRLRLTEAVASLTGLSKDRITVLKMQEGRT